MRILLVEDEKKIAQFIVKGLREEGYAVDCAENGKDAMGIIDVYEYDMIITDIMMPQLNGLEFISEIRKKQINIPIIIISAKSQIDDKIIGLDSGADDYLTKPFSFGELLARMRALLRRKSNYVEQLTFGDLELEPVTHTVSRDGRRIELTPKEYSLLEFFMRNQGRVITRTTLIEHVWDMHFDSDTNLVDVFVSYLRKKLESKNAPRLIHSVRGVGYIMRHPDSDET